MKKIIFSFFFLINCSLAYCQQSFKQNLENIATITFPDTPKTKVISSVTLFYCNYNNLLYVAQATPLDSSLKDLLKNDKVDTVYDSFIKGELNSTKGNLFYKKSIKINGVTGVEFGFTFISANKTYYFYNNLLSLNDLLVSYSLRSADSLKKDDKKITDFFDTFKFTIKNDEIRKTSGEELGYKAGHWTAIVFMIGIILSIGGLISYIIIRITNRKQL